MRVQEILGSPPAILLGMALARIVPPGVGYWISRRLARAMRKRRNNLFTTVRANIRQVVGPATSDEKLDEMAERAIYHAGCTYYDMFRQRRDSLRQYEIVLRASPETWEQVKSALQDRRGVIIAGAHMSNFDLAAQWIAAQGVEIQALSLAQPDIGTRVVNEIRRRRGVIVTPVGLDSLRAALKRLQNGGVIATGVDRPVSDHDEPLPFFGKPARLPTGHIRLALQTNAHVIAAACIQEPTGRYALVMSPPLEMERTYDRQRDIRHNALRVLALLEEMIRQAPDQWLMFVPVWPEEEEKGPVA
ncbi:MAG: lysophospholipid acyltransferase family protein [Chloroflexi bacterium]|nr:lysophospholipid acyltransferase family protein [Chloroflexota bacterium]